MNNTDASRAIDSPLYEIAIKNNKMKAKRTNKFYYSKQARIKKFLSNKYIIRIYNFTQRHSNLARILKNILLNGSIDINPNRDKKVEKKFLSKTINYETQKILPNKKIILKQSLIDLQKFSENLAPLNIIYTGVEIIDNLSLYNQYLFSSEGEQFLKNSKINFDFSTIQKSNLLTKNYKIKYDPHPNKKGHMLIAKNILESTSDNSIKMFISRTCK